VFQAEAIVEDHEASPVQSSNLQKNTEVHFSAKLKRN
jgi:hypothetical protein